MLIINYTLFVILLKKVIFKKRKVRNFFLKLSFKTAMGLKIPHNGDENVFQSYCEVIFNSSKTFTKFSIALLPSSLTNHCMVTKRLEILSGCAEIKLIGEEVKC